MHVIDDRGLLHQRVPGIGATGIVNLQAHDHVPRFQLSPRKADHHGELGDFWLPVAVVLLDVFRDLGEDLAVGRF